MSPKGRAALVVFLTTATAHAQLPVESIQRIADTARQFAASRAAPLGGDAILDVGTIDTRSLPRCTHPLTAEPAPGLQTSGQWSVGVRCRGDRPWLIYVPVTVQVMADALVASQTLARGATLSEEHFVRRRVDLARLGTGVLIDPADAIGQRLRFPVAAGTVLNGAMIEQVPVVRRGQTVTLVSGQPGFEVRVPAEALADGTAGSTIPVRNRTTRRVLEGRVEAAGLVRIPL